MKRGAIILLALLISISFTIAQTEDELNNAKENLEKAKSDLESNTNSKITKEIGIPGPLQFPARIFLGIDDTTIPFNLLIIYTAVSLFILLVIFTISKNIPFLDETSEMIRFLFALIITIITAQTGAISFSVNQLVALTTLFTAIEKFPAIYTALAIVILGAVFYAIKQIERFLSHKQELNKAEIEGEKGGAAITLLKNVWNSTTKKD